MLADQLSQLPKRSTLFNEYLFTREDGVVIYLYQERARKAKMQLSVWSQSPIVPAPLSTENVCYFETSDKAIAMASSPLDTLSRCLNQPPRDALASKHAIATESQRSNTSKANQTKAAHS